MDDYRDLQAATPENTERRRRRNAEIHQLRQQGVTLREIARRYGLSVGVINDILRRIARQERQEQKAAHDAALAAEVERLRSLLARLVDATEQGYTFQSWVNWACHYCRADMEEREKHPPAGHDGADHDADCPVRQAQDVLYPIVAGPPEQTPPRPSYALVEPDPNNLPVLTACPACTATPAFNRLLFGFIVICPYCHRRTETHQSIEDAAADWNGGR